MGPKNEQHQSESVDAQAARVIPSDEDVEEQANAGAPDPPPSAERASLQNINISPRLSSARSSDVLFDPGSAGSGRPSKLYLAFDWTGL